MKPWREIAVPHQDVRKGTFQQAEFAADITAVRNGVATTEYQDAVAFFDRTYITEGMRMLLTQVMQRLAGKGGEPVIQLQTAFGGGKTHTMLAVLHLAGRTCKISELPGIPSLIESAGLMEVPTAKTAVLDGTAHSPGQPWERGNTAIKTLWGELAWQLGQSEGFALVEEADRNGTSPGKETLINLIGTYAPCVILVDELVAYVRQFPDSQSFSGGTYDSNISFIQALTEAVKQVPNAILLASLPESEVEAGSARGVEALRALEKIFGRVQSLWKPVSPEESFEIVRRRLFEPITDTSARDAVCRAFADAYLGEGAKMPSETQEARYYERLTKAYPIHPEIFERLYEDWSTIDGFQRTRGVLKLMAKVISHLWKNNNQEPFILPASLPLSDADVRSEMTYLLPPGWDPVIDKEIDSTEAETVELEAREPRFGQIQAARRVARTLFFGTAPGSIPSKQSNRGLDRGRVLIGCIQPGQATAVYLDALNRLADRLHYLNTSGDRTEESTRYWFDTRANLRREMEDRKHRIDDRDVRRKTEEVVKRLFAGSSIFDGAHVFTPHGDVPDDSALRLVVLSPNESFTRNTKNKAEETVAEYLRSHGQQPRLRGNRLLFIAADESIRTRLSDAVRTALAWNSIVDEVGDGRLNLDQAQYNQAKKQAASAAEVLPRAARECFKWLLCPSQDDPQGSPTVEAFPLNTLSGTVSGELERVCADSQLIIDAWAPIHLRGLLQEFYWKNGTKTVEAKRFWEDSMNYLYLPRLKSKETLSSTIRTGSASKDFFGTAYGVADGKYEGFQLGQGNVMFDDALLLIEPNEAKNFEEANAPKVAPKMTGDGSAPTGTKPQTVGEDPTTLSPTQEQGSKAFHGSTAVNASLAKSQLNEIADEIIAHLASDAFANVSVSLEIHAEFPRGASAEIKRTVSENANSLKFRLKEWE